MIFIITIKDYSSERYQFVISFSFAMCVSTSEDLILKNTVSLNKLMAENDESYINFDDFFDEGYWDISKEKIDKFNLIVKDKGGEKKERNEKMVASALDCGNQISFLLDPQVNKIMEISKLIAVGISARTNAQISKSLQNKLKKYILSELKVCIDNREFLIIPCFTLWDSGNNHDANRKTQFITLNLIFLPHKKELNNFPMEKMYNFINKMSQPKLYGNHVSVSKNTNLQYFKNDKEVYSFSEFTSKLTEGICKLFNAKEYVNSQNQNNKEYFQNQMMSFICHFSLRKENCYVPNFSNSRWYSTLEKNISILLSCFLYNYYWMKIDPICEKDSSSIDDNIMNLAQDLILYLPHNVTAFFTEKRNLTVVAMHKADSFSNYSSIWTTGSETLAHEIFSIQLYLISFHTNLLRDFHNEKNTDNLDKNRGLLLDFEYLFNMETVDFDLNYRISRMQLKMGIQQRYQFLNQSITTLSTLIREKENKNLQYVVILLSVIVLFVGVIFSSSDITMIPRVIFTGVLLLALFWGNQVIWNRDELKPHWRKIKSILNNRRMKISLQQVREDDETIEKAGNLIQEKK